MKNLFKQFIILFLLILFLIIPYLVFNTNAANETPNMRSELNRLGETSGYETGVDEYSVSRIAGRVVSVLLSLLGIIFISLMLYGGYLWMTDRGNEDNVSRAKSLITNAIMGLIIVVASYAASYFVFNKIVAGNITSPNGSGTSECPDGQYDYGQGCITPG